MNRSQLRNLTLLALAVVAAPAAFAQESTGQFVGSVKTKSGEPIPGVEVRFTSPTLQGVRVVVTDASGAFRAPLMPPGQNYTISTSKTGFFGGKVEGVALGLGMVVRQDLLMTTEKTAAATVEVVATASAVDKSDVKASANITSEMMDVLPRFTRGMDTAALLAPGVAVNNTQGGRVQIRGGNTTQNRFMLNGTDIADNVFGNTDGRTYYVDDSIAETQVILSPVNARYGGFTGGIINAVTKTGGNEFTGTFRANLSRPSWSAVPPKGMRQQGPAPGNAGTQVAEDLMTRNYTLQVGGPIIKDKLWFAASTKLDPVTVLAQNLSDVTGRNVYDPSAAAPVPPATSNAYQPATSGAAFIRQDANQFYELKLTYAINSEHSLELAGNRNTTNQINRFYVLSPDPNTLVPQINKNEYTTVAYRGMLGGSASLEARWAKKHQLLAAGGDPALGDPIRAAYSDNNYYIFNNGIFDKTDGGDNRDITTWTANLQWFSQKTGIGTHTVDVGFEILSQDRRAANAQSPSGRQFFTWGRNTDGTWRTAGGAVPGATGVNFVNLYTLGKGTAKTDISSYYINDTLAISDHWQVMAGLRFDGNKAKDTLGSQTLSTSATSPRFQLRWDPQGNQAWLVSASWARYVGKLNDGFTNRFTLAGNPITEGYAWAGIAGDPRGTAGGAYNNLTTAQLTNIANWNVSQAGLVAYSGPLNRAVNASTKAPSNDETSLGIRHTYTDGSYVNFTYTKRTGKNFFNDILTIGDEVSTPLNYTTGSSPSIRNYWETDSRLKRDYNSFEVDLNNRFNAEWSLGGNYTLASLQGNSEGSEGNNPPVAGDVIGNYDSVHIARGRDESYYAPYGYLTGDVKHRARLFLNYVTKSNQGAIFNASLLFNYTGGSVYSLTRTQAFEAQTDAAAPPINSTIAGQYPTTYTRYFSPRGQGRFDDMQSFDLKLGAEIPVFRTARYFVELTVTNVFNHWQRVSYQTTAVTGNSSLITNSPMAGYRAAPLTGIVGNQTGFGTYDFNNYNNNTGNPTPSPLGRVVQLSTGFKW